MAVLRRSVLYVPALKTRAVEKSKTLPVDGIILDLEDSVAENRKELARRQAFEAVRGRGFGTRQVVIRINAEGTPHYQDDLRTAIEAGPDGILLPKTESPDSILRAAATIDRHAPASSVELWCMLETPRGVLASNDILQSHPRLAVAVMGTSDLSRDLRAIHTAMRLPLVTSLGLCLLAARTHGIVILDGVYLDLDDELGFEQACAQGRELGFDGKTLIHPKQIGPCNLAFSPTAAEVEGARAIVAAYSNAQHRGEGVTIVGGRLVEALHVTEALRILGIHETLTQARDISASRSGTP